ncbi:MAG: murein L,D-transpeptidase catalytic domain family protein [Chitinophagaceae bacterium]
MKTNGILYTFVKVNALSAFLLLTHQAIDHASANNTVAGNDTTLITNRTANLAATASFTDFPNSVIDIDDEGNPIARNARVDKKADISTPKIIFRPTSYTYPQNAGKEIGANSYSEEQLLLYAKALKQFAIRFGYDTTYAILSNMGMLSNKKRLFVINLTTMQIEYRGLVSHGRGGSESIYDKQYSNKAGSRCTALGKYRIAGRYNGSYGTSYKVHGLEVSNSNAYNRNIVVHPMGCIPDVEGIAPACVSDGCPAVSQRSFAYIQKIIDTRKQSILLWIFDSNLEEAVVEAPPAPAAPATEPTDTQAASMWWAKSK